MYNEIKVIININDKEYYFDYGILSPLVDFLSVPKINSDRLNKIVEALKDYDYTIRIVPA